jgi:hypothetical protein
MVNRYRVWCNTEGRWVYAWSESEPTSCPNDPDYHVIDAAKTALVQVVVDMQAYTSDGAAVTTTRDQAELPGNAVLLKRLDAELAPETCANKDWTIPDGRTWRVRLFAASATSYEVEASLEYFRKVAGTTPTTTGPPDSGFARVNPFDADADEPFAVLKLSGNSDSTVYYEGLSFSGDGESFLRIRLANKDALDSVEASAYFNGYETGTA